jgi:hypothetical protein
VPALPPYIIEPIWQQFEALLPERRTDHPRSGATARASPKGSSSRSWSRSWSSAVPTRGSPTKSALKSTLRREGGMSGSSLE